MARAGAPARAGENLLPRNAGGGDGERAGAAKASDGAPPKPKARELLNVYDLGYHSGGDKGVPSPAPSAADLSAMGDAFGLSGGNDLSTTAFDVDALIQRLDQGPAARTQTKKRRRPPSWGSATVWPPPLPAPRPPPPPQQPAAVRALTMAMANDPRNLELARTLCAPPIDIVEVPALSRKRAKRVAVVVKDAKYVERRRKNTAAAKKNRMRKRQKKLLEEAQANARAELVQRTGVQDVGFAVVTDAVASIGQRALPQEWSPALDSDFPTKTEPNGSP